ncbi:hypothetical protein TCAL_05104 [Tigriopus californicus]|uniref:Uncharacterized protein n=1 Tax=Tigriopus californicus TaxID=6832 RepID=A0A553NS30_TIGCA|nr:uncharacterized protein LOC131880478 [Tigriopus californicus]TRY68245.1 hypothetical protein TCAL_05104 [Tigriopus californicus]
MEWPDFDFNVWLYCSLLAGMIPILIPALQFGFIFRLWDQYNKPVNRMHCQNSCWDTVFKAGYETGVGSYKHVYFNATSNALMMWSLTVLCVIGLYEGIRKVFMSLYHGTARPRMVILFLSVVFPHYYAWWAYFNYYNDDYFDQFWHQLFFTVTEMASTLTVLSLIDKSSVVTPRKTLVIISIAVLHIVASGWDQFVENVLRQEGMLHQILRDLGFMIPDLLHMWIPWLELRDMAQRRRVPPSHLIKTEDFIGATVFVALAWMICLLIK